MAERLFSYGDVPILLDSSHNMLCETPRITGLQPLDDGQPVATVHHRVADSFALNREGEHSISIEGPLELTNAIFYLGELAAESYRQSELGGALVHAAAIYKDALPLEAALFEYCSSWQKMPLCDYTSRNSLLLG